jgi:hypothetical protein
MTGPDFRKLEDVAEELGVPDKSFSIDERAEHVLDYTGDYVPRNFPEVMDLIDGHINGNPIPEETIRKLVELAGRGRNDKSFDELAKDFGYIIECARGFLDIRKTNPRKIPEFLKACGGHPHFLTIKYFDAPVNYDARDILDLGMMPQSCTSYAILAHDLLKLGGINSQVIDMFCQNNESDRHSVLRYQREDGSWRRCDPNWQKRLDKDGKPAFFKYHPELKEDFCSELTRFVYGGEFDEGTLSRMKKDADGRIPVHRYDAERVLR